MYKSKVAPDNTLPKFKSSEDWCLHSPKTTHALRIGVECLHFLTDTWTYACAMVLLATAAVTSTRRRTARETSIRWTMCSSDTHHYNSMREFRQRGVLLTRMLYTARTGRQLHTWWLVIAELLHTTRIQRLAEADRFLNMEMKEWIVLSLFSYRREQWNRLW